MSFPCRLAGCQRALSSIGRQLRQEIWHLPLYYRGAAGRSHGFSWHCPGWTPHCPDMRQTTGPPPSPSEQFHRFSADPEQITSNYLFHCYISHISVKSNENTIMAKTNVTKKICYQLILNTVFWWSWVTYALPSQFTQPQELTGNTGKTLPTNHSNDIVILLIWIETDMAMQISQFPVFFFFVALFTRTANCVRDIPDICTRLKGCGNPVLASI